METNQETSDIPHPIGDSSTIEVFSTPEGPQTTTPEANLTEPSTDATRKSKRRSGTSVDLTYRYHEPSEEELSWTEDEQGNRRKRKSHGRKSGGGDDFKTGIVPVEGKKRQRRRRSGQSARDSDDGLYAERGEGESESEDSDHGKRVQRKRLSGKSDDFRTGIVPRGSKPRKKKRRSNANEAADADSTYSGDVQTSEDDNMGGEDQRKKAKRGRNKRISSTSDRVDIGIEHIPTHTVGKPYLPELGDGWTNVEWAILEHTHDHIRSLGDEEPEKIDADKLAEAFLKIYETSELKLKAEEEGMETKGFSKQEVKDRIIALRETRERRKSGELPPAETLDSATSLKPGENLVHRRLSGILSVAKFW